MEAASAGAGEKDHLKNVLSEDELANIPTIVTSKINGYIENKFEEYLTSKALHETGKTLIGDKIAASENKVIETTVKYEEVLAKLATADATVSELGQQVESLNQELEKALDKINRMENECISMKSARDAAVDERNDLTRILQRRDAEVERLTTSEASLSQQLRAAIDAKCEALALNDEIQSKELSLQYREKRIEQERVLLNSQIAGLTEEVNRLTSELQTVRLNNTSRLVNLETQLTEKTEELNAANETITQLNEVKKNLTTRAENLSQRLMEQRELENKMADNYKKELDAKSKLADLFKTMHDDAESKTMELTEGISELQKLLNEATEKYGEMETRFKQAELDNEELMEKKNEIIASLKNELEHANDLLKAANAQNLDMALSDLAPSAAAASKLLKSGLSLTQVYSQLVKVTDDLAQEKDENRRLNATINTIVQELEEKAPLLQKQRSEYDEALESNVALTQQIDSLVIELNRLRDDYSETSKIANHYSRENSRLKGELADLGRQVCFLLKEIEQSRGGPLPNGDHDSSQTTSNTTNSSDLSASRVISKTLVTFSDIQELQNNNQKLLRMIRDLTEKQEDFERYREQFESGEMQGKIESLKNRVAELTEAQDRQTKMVNGLIRQRDMFKKLYHDLMKGKRHETSSMLDPQDDSLDLQPMDTSSEQKRKSVGAEPSTFEVKYKEVEKQLEHLREEYKTYKEEKVTNERILFDQIENMRQEISKLTAANSKCSSTSEYNNERLKILQTNITTYKKQIASLEDKNKAYNTTIAKHEVSLQHLRDEALNAQGKLAAAEITVENLRLEVKLHKDTELRLQTEKEVLNRERQGQAMLLKNLELIKASLERVETESGSRLEGRLDEATRECAALRRRLQEEQDRFRELAAHLERQTETAQARAAEERAAADALRAEAAQLRQDLRDKTALHDQLAKKLKLALAPNEDGSLDSNKKIKELENRLADRDAEINALKQQMTVAKEHMKQYCDISECAEKELKKLSVEYDTYKTETEKKLSEYAELLQKLQDRCSELEAELSLQSNAGEQTGSSVSLTNELAVANRDLAAVLANYESCHSELQLAREEVSKLSQVAQSAEEKYAHEMVLHSSDIQSLTHVKEELSRVQNELNELVALKNSAVEKMEAEMSAFANREKMMIGENEQLVQRLADLNAQNSLLHEQVGALGAQLAATRAARAHGDSAGANDSHNDSTVNVSLNEEDGKSSEQLFQIVKFLRKEKDIAVAKFDILQAETMRLKSQLEIAEKKLDDAKLTLASEREKSEVNMVTVNKQSDILRKVETLNALADSNRILREERDSLSARVEELTAATKTLEESLVPLQDKITELTSKSETLQSENTSLKSDSARWRTRVNALVERANKTSPEDWKRLQNERETLAKMLTTEKENVNKLNEELGVLKIEKTKIEEQYSILSRQQNALAEDNKKINEELHTLKDDMARLTEELARVKAELSVSQDKNNKLNEELASKEASLTDIRNKELQIRKIAKKYKAQYEELVKTVEEDKQKTEGEAAASQSQTAEAARQLEEQLSQLQAQLDAERIVNETIKQELEVQRAANLEKEEKAKQVLKQAKMKIVQLTEAKNALSRDLNESRTKIESIEQSTRDEQDVRLALIKSQYEGRLVRLEKERSEAAAERARDQDALQQRLAALQRQLASQAAAGKQPSAEKPASDPPTANIKPMAGVAQQSVSARSRGGETPLASIRPMAQVGPTATAPPAPAPAPSPAPHDAHTTEYMPASSSRPLPRAAVAASTATPAAASSASSASPPESTQDMDTTSEAGVVSAAPSDSPAQSSSHSQPPTQAVALVLPRMEQPGGASSSGVASAPASTSAAAPAAPAPAPSPAPASGASAGGEAAGVSTSHAPEPRPGKRPRAQQRPSPAAKRTRVQQGFERSVEVEYQVPTSSRCDQDDEGVIVVDSEDDERCSGTMYQEAEEEDEDMDEEQDAEAGEEEEEEDEDAEEEEEEDPEGDGENNPSAQQDTPEQSPEQGAEGAGGGGAGEAGDAPQAEAISSGTEPSGALSLGGGGGGDGDDGDDSIVPSTPTLYVPRRNDGFGEAVVSPAGGGGGGGGGGAGAPRFTFAEAGAASHHDTHADLAAALPPPAPPAAPAPAGSAGAAAGAGAGTGTRGDEEAVAVSSQGSESPATTQPAGEEGREAEASSPARRRPQRSPQSSPQRSPQQPAPRAPHAHTPRPSLPDSESGPGWRGRGARARGRPPRRPHHYMRY